jgi:uncharacterized protein with ParB-like and HNH nuclease domain
MRTLEIPFFQRAYVWGEDQWDRLIEDMENITNSKKHYFMGSIILKHNATSTEGDVGDRRTIIDGQQRLTTLNIFFKVFGLKNHEFAPMFDRTFRIMRKNSIALQHNHNDKANFDRILSLEKEENIEGSSSIIEAYNYFRNHIDIKKLDFDTIMSKMMFVVIDLSYDEDEQQIFDTINSLGVRLTTAELLKNYFFDKTRLASFESNWKSVFEKDDEAKSFWDEEITAGRMKRENIDLFFYSFLQIKLQDKQLNVSADDKKDLAKVEGLFESYKRFITTYGINKDALVSEIKDYAMVYRKSIDFDIVDKELSPEYGIERINALIFGLDNTTLLPFVLYVQKNIEDRKTQRDIYHYLESYLMRRMVCHASNKNYNHLFSDQLIAAGITDRLSLSTLIETKADKGDFMPSDKDVSDAFHDSRLANKQAAGILYMLESMIRNRKSQSTALLGLNHYSLEHVMPKKWENHWDKLSNENDKYNRNKALLTLGNLTIITSSLNTSIRDADWNTKKNGKAGKHGLKQYASGIETFSKFLEYEIWDEGVIKERADFLAKHANEVWKV